MRKDELNKKNVEAIMEAGEIEKYKKWASDRGRKAVNARWAKTSDEEKSAWGKKLAAKRWNND